MKRHYLILSALISVVATLLAIIFLNVHLTPAVASAQAEPIDRLLRLLFAIGSIFLAIGLVTLIYSAVVFRRRRGDTGDGPPIRGLTPLEVVWTLVPLGIVVWLAFQGAVVLKDISRVPATGEVLEVKVTASQWQWRFDYPQWGIASPDLRLPVNRPVRFELTSRDVIHSFWVPQWRVKQDAVPGRTTVLVVTPTRVGDYQLLCAELCGLGHALMKAPVRVIEAADFESWVKERGR